MKKLLVFLMVVIATFLFAGCNGVTPDPVDPGEPGICPKVEITSEVEVTGKNYIKGGEQTITVTFAVPTEPVSVYVGSDLKNNGYLPGYEVVMYSNDDKTVYTGDFVFGEEVESDCNEAYIYVETCETCDYCKYPYTIDTVAPYANILITEGECPCEDNYSIKFNSEWIEEDPENVCEPLGGCCGDDCSELASWKIVIYDRDPSGECNGIDPCTKILYSCEGTACPILCITDCTDDAIWFKTRLWVVVELEDVVGNTREYYTNFMYADLVDPITIGECPDN